MKAIPSIIAMVTVGLILSSSAIFAEGRDVNTSTSPAKGKLAFCTSCYLVPAVSGDLGKVVPGQSKPPPTKPVKR